MIKILDLFCGVGGASKGYKTAFEKVGKCAHITGIDIEEQPEYCGDTFIQADALDFLRDNGNEFDIIHASPPCQASSALTKGTNKKTRSHLHIDLIDPVRQLLKQYDKPTIIENVQGAKIRKDLTLCGEMFGLEVLRHRYFELENIDYKVPTHKKHRGRVKGWRHGQYYDGPYFAVYGLGGGKGTVEEWQRAMNIDWTRSRRSLSEAIPPNYTQYIGSFLT